MASCPGETLELFLAWNFNLIIDDLPEANLSLGLAEMMGSSVKPRPTLTTEQFTEIVNMYEPCRGAIEMALSDFDEGLDGSWRTYGSYVLSHYYHASEEKELENRVMVYLKSIGKR